MRDAPEPFKLGHRKALDGVRGMAILLVVLSHIPIFPFGGGFIGVDLFFVLSGYLITSLLLEEWRESGTLSLKAFYARRALRLLPALVVMLGAVVLYSALRETPAESAAMRKAALMTLLYSANWFMAFKAYPRIELTPSWSLSVEEQFYLAWPLLLLLMLRAGLSRKAVVGVTFAGVLASAGLRAWRWSAGGSFERVMFGTDCHADGLLFGALAAFGMTWGGAIRAPSTVRWLNVSSHLTVVALLWFAVEGWAADAQMMYGGYFAFNLAAAVLVVTLVTSPGPLLRGLFEFGPLVWLGKVSYGIYLWHMAVFLAAGSLGRWGRWHWAATLALLLAVSALSFYLLERPILRFKRRFERVRPEAPSAP